MAAAVRPRLILHFDVNETVMVGDPAGGDTFEDTLNKVVAKNAFVSLGREQSETLDPNSSERPHTWYEGTPLDSSSPPPLHLDWEWPVDAVAAYRHPYFKPFKRNFTEAGSPGQHYRPLYEQMEQALRWPSDADPPDRRLSHDGVHHFLIPALFHTITELKAQGREFTVVIRTFGTDVDDVCAALNAYAEGLHTISSIGSEAAISPESVYVGRYQEDGTFQLKQAIQGGEAITDENVVVKTLEAATRGPVAICAVQDDWEWWSRHGWVPSAGKPLWLTRDDSSCHHIFFDDNIHNLAEDSIVAVRARDSESSSFEPLGGKATLALHGVHLVRVPTIAPILNSDFFLEKIQECEASRASATRD